MLINVAEKIFQLKQARTFVLKDGGPNDGQPTSVELHYWNEPYVQIISLDPVTMWKGLFTVSSFLLDKPNNAILAVDEITRFMNPDGSWGQKQIQVYEGDRFWLPLTIDDSQLPYGYPISGNWTWRGEAGVDVRGSYSGFEILDMGRGGLEHTECWTEHHPDVPDDVPSIAFYQHDADGLVSIRSVDKNGAHRVVRQ